SAVHAAGRRVRRDRCGRPERGRDGAQPSVGPAHRRRGHGRTAAPARLQTCWSGRSLVTAGRVYPSSKTCVDCGAVKAKLRLSERTFTCEHYGHTADRDHNAARNLVNLAEGADGTSTASY